VLRGTRICRHPDPLAGIQSDVLARVHVPRLEQLRLQALEWRITADLNLGLPAGLIPELGQLVAGHPFREPFHAQLMLALYRCGRQAEALAAYQRARRVLVAELGVEPGPELRTLHQRMLAADPVLAGPPTTAADPVLVGPLATAGDPASAALPGQPPRQLPAAPRMFTGRVRELASLAARPGQVTVITGTPGAGKTALAVYWAHQVAARFPDGQLYLNLRGYDQAEPVPAADALAIFLRALGRPRPRHPGQPGRTCGQIP
jgi:hypothetical protein